MLVRLHRLATVSRAQHRVVRCPHCGYSTTEISGFCPSCLLVRFPSGQGGLYLLMAVAAVVTTWTAAFLILGGVLGWL